MAVDRKVQELELRTITNRRLLIVGIVLIVVVFDLFGKDIPHPELILHSFAMLFLVVVTVRLLSRYLSSERAARTFAKATALSAVILALPHIVDIVFDRHVFDELDASFANYYMIAILVIAVAAVHVLRYTGAKARVLGLMTWLFVAAFILSAVTVPIWSQFTDIRNGDAFFWSYTVLFMVGILMTLFVLRKLGRRLRHLEAFTRDMQMATLLIFVAAGPHVYGSMLISRGLTGMLNIVTAGHYAIFAALALLFIAFDDLTFMHGIHEELLEERVDAMAASGA